MGFPPKSERWKLCCSAAQGGHDFVLDRTAVVDGRVEPLGVVEAVDVLADDVLGVVEVGEGMQPSALELEGREQALGDSIVLAVACAAHAADDAHSVEARDVVVGAIGAAAVRMMDEPGWRLCGAAGPGLAPPGPTPCHSCRSSVTVRRTAFFREGSGPPTLAADGPRRDQERPCGRDSRRAAAERRAPVGSASS